MRLRIAKKICAAVGTERESAYSQKQIRTAIDKMERTKDAKESTRFFDALMLDIGVVGRAQILAGSGAPGMAFDLLMREKW